MLETQIPVSEGVELGNDLRAVQQPRDAPMLAGIYLCAPTHEREKGVNVMTLRHQIHQARETKRQAQQPWQGDGVREYALKCLMNAADSLEPGLPHEARHVLECALGLATRWRYMAAGGKPNSAIVDAGQLARKLNSMGQLPIEECRSIHRLLNIDSTTPKRLDALRARVMTG